MNRKKIEFFLGFLTLIVSILAWFSVRNAVIVATSSTWTIPVILFSIYLIFICLDVVIFRHNLWLKIVLLGSFVLSLLFAFSWFQLIAISVGGFFLFLAIGKIKTDLDLNIKIDIRKSLQTGKTYLIISLALVISMQYFLTINSFDGEKKIPNFDASIITKKIAIPFISAINPQFKALEDETLTVDEFILQTQNSTQTDDLIGQSDDIIDAQIPEYLAPEQKDSIKKQAKENLTNVQDQLRQKNQELICENGRKQLSDIVGVPISGKEKISDIFIGMINNKINDYFNPKINGSKKNIVFPMILAIILLLTIYPIGLLFSIIVFMIVKLIVHILIYQNILMVKNVSVTKEFIE